MKKRKSVVRRGRGERLRDMLLFMDRAIGWQSRATLIDVMDVTDSGYASRLLQACVDAGVLERRRVEPVNSGANPRSEYRMTDAATNYTHTYGHYAGVEGLVEASDSQYRMQDDNAGRPHGGRYDD